MEALVILALLICSQYTPSTYARSLEGQAAESGIEGLGVFESLPKENTPPQGHAFWVHQ